MLHGPVGGCWSNFDGLQRGHAWVTWGGSNWGCWRRSEADPTPANGRKERPHSACEVPARRLRVLGASQAGGVAVGSTLGGVRGGEVGLGVQEGATRELLG